MTTAQLAEEPTRVATPGADSIRTAWELSFSRIESLGVIQALQVTVEPAATVVGAFTLKVTA